MEWLDLLQSWSGRAAARRICWLQGIWSQTFRPIASSLHQLSYPRSHRTCKVRKVLIYKMFSCVLWRHFREENQVALLRLVHSNMHALYCRCCVQLTSDNWSKQHNVSNFRLVLLSCFDKLVPIQLLLSRFVIQDFKNSLTFVQKLA
jgi:hypothetical protein